MKQEQFQDLIRRILKEEVEKQSSTNQKIINRVPEVNHGSDLKEIIPHKHDTMTKDELLDDMDKVVKEIDKSFTTVWDDHDDISINARDLYSIRISPRWENNYNIEFFIRNEDRVYITGMTWDKVKQFVKDNLSRKPKTAVDGAMDKVVKNREDQTDSSDKGLPKKDKLKILPLTNEEPKTAKNKEMNYTEKQVKNDEDLPEKPMREVGKDFKKLIDYKVKSPEKISKFKQNTKLTVDIDKKTPKFKETK